MQKFIMAWELLTGLGSQARPPGFMNGSGVGIRGATSAMAPKASRTSRTGTVAFMAEYERPYCLKQLTLLMNQPPQI